MRRLASMAHVGLTERLDESVLSLAAQLGEWLLEEMKRDEVNESVSVASMPAGVGTRMVHL